jgi:hypothetical protein
MKLRLDSDKSVVRVRTFADGFLAKLAHDLELVCRGISGHGERLGPDSATCTIEVPVAQIDIGGVLKKGTVDPRGLSGFERKECLSKMQKDVFQTGRAGGTVQVVGTLDGGKARLRITVPNGREVVLHAPIHVVETTPSVHASGTVSLSLDSIGSVPVKGPINAFRMKDAVEISFDLVLVES